MTAPLRRKAKTAFKKSKTIGPYYTSGPVAITPDGSRTVTCVRLAEDNGDDVIFTDISTGTELGRFATDSQQVTALCISPSSKYLCMFTSSMSLRIFELPSDSQSHQRIQPIRVIARAHDGPVHVCKVDPTSSYLASGSADGIVKVWDIVRGYVTHLFRGHGGVVSALAFNYRVDHSSASQTAKMQLISASVDTRIRIFDLSAVSKAKGPLKPIAVLEGHASVPRGLDVTLDGRTLLSGGRDSVVLVWDITATLQDTSTKGKSKMPHITKTIPVLEPIEALGLLHSDELVAGSHNDADGVFFYTGGQRGLLKIWDMKAASVTCTFGTHVSVEEQEQRQILDVLYLPSTSSLVSIHADQNILLYSIPTQKLDRQLIGFNDEIVDATFLTPSPGASQRDSHLALATNSSLIRVYSTSTLDARLLEGHTDIVLSLDHSADGSVLASTSKDKSGRLWAPVEVDSKWSYRCVAICEGHAESVGAVALSRQSEAGFPQFVFTGSQDRTIKMWDLSKIGASRTVAPVKCSSLTTVKAHDKDINSLDVSPNDKLLVSGSQDRTAKVYEIRYSANKSVRGEMKEIGVCRGHKRGVWNVRFGRTERVLATGSGDKTVKLWNLDDFSCVKTFEGHTNSVLRLDFINDGTQIVSAASDGLVKLWNVAEEECVATMDNHEDKVWALAVSSDEQTIVSGSADSVVTFWTDCTEEQEAEKESKRAEIAEREQDFLNYVSLKDYRKAIELALAMDQPGRLLSLFRKLLASPTSEMTLTGDASVDEVIRTLGGTDIAKLLRFVRNWNANAKTSHVAQTVLHAIVKLRRAQDIMGAFEDEKTLGMLKGDGTSSGGTALKELVDALIPYTERHLSRMNNLVQQSYLVDFILSEMDDGMVGDSMEVD